MPDIIVLSGLSTRVVGYLMYTLAIYLLVDKRKIKLAILITCSFVLILLGRAIQFV